MATDGELRLIHEAARSLLSEAGGTRTEPPHLVIAPRKDACSAIAFLVTFRLLGRSDALVSPHVVLPLRSGLNRICRGTVGDHALPPLSAAPPRVDIIEQGQWIIECAPKGALVRDAWSSNLSAVVRASVPLSEDPRNPPFVEGQRSPRRLVIQHANLNPRPVALEDGDTLIGVYASFIFGTL